MDEYVCKNSVKQKPLTVRLHSLYLDWDNGEAPSAIGYESIEQIRLVRKGDLYKIGIASASEEIVLCNRFYLPNGEFEDRSRKYVTFVRVLHLHLQKNRNVKYLLETNWISSLFGSKKSYDATDIPLEFLPS